MFRVGIGWDQHPMADGRQLVLGGERFSGPRGLGGHSDADVLAHAICDAVLGALGMPDLGAAFPDTDPALEGADSLGLLTEIARRMREAGYRVGNVDAVVIAQEPRLAGRLGAMRQNLARALGCEPEAVNAKASSPEKLGSLGRAEGIAAHAVVLLVRESPPTGG